MLLRGTLGHVRYFVEDTCAAMLLQRAACSPLTEFKKTVEKYQSTVADRATRAFEISQGR